MQTLCKGTNDYLLVIEPGSCFCSTALLCAEPFIVTFTRLNQPHIWMSFTHRNDSFFLWRIYMEWVGIFTCGIFVQVGKISDSVWLSFTKLGTWQRLDPNGILVFQFNTAKCSAMSLVYDSSNRRENSVRKYLSFGSKRCTFLSVVSEVWPN